MSHFEVQRAITCICCIVERDEFKRRQFLVFINPYAGSKNGESLFKKYVQPMLDIADISYIVQMTSKSNSTTCLQLCHFPPIHYRVSESCYAYDQML